MTIIVFLVDTSASMAMKTYMGTTVLDFARKTIEEFLKQLTIRQSRDQQRDRYMLMTFDEYPNNVKVGWKEGVTIFNEQLKNLKANGITTFGPAFGAALRFINLNRMQIGLENYGFGRNPTYTDPVVFVAITDGSSLSDPTFGAVDEIKFSKPTSVGNELTEEPFRWDQRLFSIVLRLPGGQTPKLKTPFSIPPDPSRVEEMCNVTGGRSFSITSHKMLSACVEMIVQKIQMNGVLIKLEKYGPDPLPVQNGVITNGESESDVIKSRQIQFPESAWRSQLVMVLRANKFVSSSSTGFWPIPEAFWPDSNATALPPRRAHPIVLFKCEQTEPIINTEFPFDKYELEYCALTQYILERKQPNLCWQVFVSNSSKQSNTTGGLGHPFGYLKVSSNMQSVTLVILPYNYPMLMSILEESKDKRIRSEIWRTKMAHYFNTVPPYYISALKKHLKKLNISHPIIDDPVKDQVYSQQVITHLTKIKYIGKEEFDGACAAVARAIQDVLKGEADRIRNLVPVKKSTRRIKSEKKGKYQPLAITQAMSKFTHVYEERFKDYKISIMDPKMKPPPSMQFLNAFDIERPNMLGQMAKMSLNLEMQLKNSKMQLLEGGKPGTKIRLQHAEDLHNQLIGSMGDYQSYMQSLSRIGFAPLRELEPSTARPHAFGNPFKLDKKNMTIDEVGEANSSLPNITKTPADRQERQQVSAERSQRRRRKQGPLDPTALETWRRRRRSMSMYSSDMSETSSITSDISDISSLDDEMTIISHGVVQNGFITPERVDETVDDFARFSPEPDRKGKKKQAMNGFNSKLPGLKTSASIDSIDEGEIIEIPMKRARLDTPRTPTMPSEPAKQENLKKLHDTKFELSQIVKRVGNRTKLHQECLSKVNHLSDVDKEDALRFALREAERFKNSSLMSSLTHDVNRLAKKAEAERNAKNNSKDLISDILGH